MKTLQEIEEEIKNEQEIEKIKMLYEIAKANYQGQIIGLENFKTQAKEEIQEHKKYIQYLQGNNEEYSASIENLKKNIKDKIKEVYKIDLLKDIEIPNYIINLITSLNDTVIELVNSEFNKYLHPKINELMEQIMK